MFFGPLSLRPSLCLVASLCPTLRLFSLSSHIDHLSGSPAHYRSTIIVARHLPRSPASHSPLTPGSSGLKRITLKVRVDNPQATWRPSLPESSLGLGAPGTGSGPTIPVEEVIAPDGMPTTPIMRHLLDVFMTHFGCQFPFVDRQDLEAKIEERTGSVFLLNSIAAMAAR